MPSAARKTAGTATKKNAVTPLALKKSAVAKKSTDKSSVAKKPLAQKSATGKTAATKSVAKKSITGKIATEKPTVKKTAAQKTAPSAPPKKPKPANNKTQESDASVTAFLASVSDPVRRADAHELLALMRRATGETPKMWGSAIVGFGKYRLVYESGRAQDWMLAAFSPRKQNLVVYVMDGFPQYRALLAKLGKHTTGKSCLYLNRLADVNADVLSELVTLSVQAMRAKYLPA